MWHWLWSLSTKNYCLLLVYGCLTIDTEFRLDFFRRSKITFLFWLKTKKRTCFHLYFIFTLNCQTQKKCENKGKKQIFLWIQAQCAALMPTSLPHDHLTSLWTSWLYPQITIFSYLRGYPLTSVIKVKYVKGMRSFVQNTKLLIGNNIISFFATACTV